MEKEYFMWNNNGHINIYICVGNADVEHHCMWKMVYSSHNPELQGIIYEAMTPENYKRNGIAVINKTQVALIKLQDGQRE